MTWGTCDHEEHVCQHVFGSSCVNFHAAHHMSADSAIPQPPAV